MENKEIALICCIIINEDVLGGTVFQTFDKAWELAEKFHEQNQDKNWEHQKLDFDEAIVEFVTQYIEDEKRNNELNWWRKYGYFVSKHYTNVDAEACGYADGDGDE